MDVQENECQISHKNGENTGKILKVSCVRCNFVKFDNHFLWLPCEIFFTVITDDLFFSLPAACRRPFLAWGDFHARSRFARSTIPEDKWGLLVV